MPDLFAVIVRRWKTIVFFSLSAALLAFLLCLLLPKKYAGIATALAANPALTDRARVFNQSIEGLYSALGSADELDKVEGTARLDTVYLALADSFQLPVHYRLDTQQRNVLYKAAMQLKAETTINRTGFGELRIKVWDKKASMAAALANAALKKLNEIHQQVQTENNRMVLQRLKEAYVQKHQQMPTDDTSRVPGPGAAGTVNTALTTAQLAQYAALINEYELALQTAPKVLLTVEPARPAPVAGKPNVVQTVLVAFVAALLFSFLLVLFLESRKPAA